MVLPLLAVMISPGLYALADTMFSHDATMKWTSTLGLSSAIARAAPRTVPDPPMSN